MKLLTLFTLTLVLTTAMALSTATAQEAAPGVTLVQEKVPWRVYLVYFRASDYPGRPNADAEIDGFIKEARRFFADQLELHGFDRKTFQFDTDAAGNAVVHHVIGKFPNAHYAREKAGWEKETREQIQFPPRSIPVYMLGPKPGTRFIGISFATLGRNSGGRAFIAGHRWNWRTIAHELGHTFGLKHDWRADANAKRIKTFTTDPMLTSFCAAEWLSVHPAFNPGQAVPLNWDGNATIKMLPPTFVSPPDTVRLRFEVNDPEGIHQVQLWMREFLSKGRGGLLDCSRLNGARGTVEFVTTELRPGIDEVELTVIDERGHITWESFPININAIIEKGLAVAAKGKAATTWGSLKKKHR